MFHFEQIISFSIGVLTISDFSILEQRLLFFISPRKRCAWGNYQNKTQNKKMACSKPVKNMC